MWGGAEMSLHFTQAMRCLLACFQIIPPLPKMSRLRATAAQRQ